VEIQNVWLIIIAKYNTPMNAGEVRVVTAAASHISKHFFTRND
jgi:hypothetical protein